MLKSFNSCKRISSKRHFQKTSLYVSEKLWSEASHNTLASLLSVRWKITPEKVKVGIFLTAGEDCVCASELKGDNRSAAS